jgi:hypothetical protein
MEELSEKEIEETIARHSELIEKGLILTGRQATFRGKRVDLIFKDETGATLIVELKKGIVEQKDVGQLTDYLGLIGQQEKGRIRIMLVGSVIPKLRRDGMDRIGIEYREISLQDYIQFLKENDPTLLEKLQRVIPKPITPLGKEVKERSLSTPIYRGEQRFWIFQTNPSTTFDYLAWLSFWNNEWDTFRVKHHIDDIHKDDMVAIWVAQGNSKEERRGIYAIAEVLTEPEMKMILPEKKKFFLKREEEPRIEVRIHYIKKLLGKDTILASKIQDDPILRELRILKQPQGTNYPVTPEQWQRITELARLAS